jgi:hypothetical protein
MIDQLAVRHWHGLYVRCEEARDTSATLTEITDAINAAYVATSRAITAEGYGVENDDTAEALVGAITWFFFMSNPTFISAIPRVSQGADQ